MSETTVQFMWFIVITLVATLLQIALFLGVVALVVLIVKKLWKQRAGRESARRTRPARQHRTGLPGPPASYRLEPARRHRAPPHSRTHSTKKAPRRRTASAAGRPRVNPN